MQLLTWALPVLGTTLIITCSSLFRSMRESLTGTPWLGKLVACPMCAGFWVGGVASLLGWSAVALSGDSHSIALRVFGDATAAAYVCWASHVMLCASGQGKLLSRRTPEDS